MINKTNPNILQNIDSEVAILIAKKTVTDMDALRIFLNSQTHNVIEWWYEMMVFE